MNIQSIDKALKKGNKKLVKQLTKNGEKLARFAYEGDFKGVIDLIENQPVDLDYKMQTTKWTIEESAKAGASGNGKKIIALIKAIRSGEVTRLDEFNYSENKTTKPQQKTLKNVEGIKTKLAVGISLSTYDEITDYLSSNFGVFVAGRKDDIWPTHNDMPMFFSMPI